MARKKRIWIPQYFYHVVCRGNHREPLFKEQEDFEAFLYILEQVHKRHPFELATYCLMTNHFHLQIRSQKQEISKVMALINRRYVSYFNIKYNLSGHLFEKRYYDKIIPNEKGMLDVSRYIHLNPVAAGMVTKPEEYCWSSYSSYQGGGFINLPFLKQKILLDYFSGSIDEQRKKYCEVVISNISSAEKD